MTVAYCGAPIKDEFLFDVELISTVIESI